MGNQAYQRRGLMSQKKKKVQYKVRNWSEYNQALTKRGSVTVWFTEDVKESWLNTSGTGSRGRKRTYTDVAIECILVIQAVFHLPLRQTQGLMTSLMSLLGVALAVPHYSTYSRRRTGLEVSLPRQRQGQSLHLVVDTTGLKVYGQGEWRLHKYHPQDHAPHERNPRLWRKVHLGVDEATGEVMACVVTEKDVHDKTLLPEVLAQIEEPLEQVTADKGYDYISCYDAIAALKARPVIPPRRNATIHHTDQFARRDAHVQRIQEVGRQAWKQESNYHRRSLAETAVYRLKTIFGPRLSSRKLENQHVEARLRCRALNLMTHLGMPDSYPVAVAA
jgi:hypothetical protein